MGKCKDCRHFVEWSNYDECVTALGDQAPQVAPPEAVREPHFHITYCWKHEKKVSPNYDDCPDFIAL